MGPREELNDLHAQVDTQGRVIHDLNRRVLALEKVNATLLGMGGGLDMALAQRDKRIAALEANTNPAPGLVQMSRELYDQLVETLQAIHEGTDLSDGVQTTSYADLHDIAAEALDRLGIQPE